MSTGVEVLGPESPQPPEKRSPAAVRIFRWAAILGLIGWAGWSIQNFLSLRGVVNLLASRISLCIFAVCMIGALWIVAVDLQKKLAWRIIGALILVLVAFFLDWWAPKPTSASTPT